MTHTYIKKKKNLTYSNSVATYEQRQNATEKIPVKSYLKGSIYCGKDTNRYHKSFPKACNGVFAIA